MEYTVNTQLSRLFPSKLEDAHKTDSIDSINKIHRFSTHAGYDTIKKHKQNHHHHQQQQRHSQIKEESNE